MSQKKAKFNIVDIIVILILCCCGSGNSGWNSCGNTCGCNTNNRKNT